MFAGMRSFNLEVKFANGVTHRLHIDANMSATVGAIEFDGSPDPGSSTLEFSMDIGTNVISIIADEPLETVDFDAGLQTLERVMLRKRRSTQNHSLHLHKLLNACYKTQMP